MTFEALPKVPGVYKFSQARQAVGRQQLNAKWQTSRLPDEQKPSRIHGIFLHFTERQQFLFLTASQYYISSIRPFGIAQIIPALSKWLREGQVSSVGHITNCPSFPLHFSRAIATCWTGRRLFNFTRRAGRSCDCVSTASTASVVHVSSSLQCQTSHKGVSFNTRASGSRPLT